MLTSALRWHFGAIVPWFLSSYQSVSAASDLLSERHICAFLLAFIQISVYPSIHSLSSAMSKLHNLQSTAEGSCVYVRPGQCRMEDTSLNREIHANLVNAVLTGLSCNDIGCVLPVLHVIFHLSQQTHSTTALLMMRVCQTHTRHLLYRARHSSCHLHVESACSSDIRGFFVFHFHHLQNIRVQWLYCILEIFASFCSFL